MIKSYGLLTCCFYEFQISPDFWGEKNKTWFSSYNSSKFEIRKFWRLSKIINWVMLGHSVYGYNFYNQSHIIFISFLEKI